VCAGDDAHLEHQQTAGQTDPKNGNDCPQRSIQFNQDRHIGGIQGREGLTDRELSRLQTPKACNLKIPFARKLIPLSTP